MKKKILLFILRVVRFLKMEDKLMPELDHVPVKQVRIGRLYQHYGRIVVARRNDRDVSARFLNAHGSQITEEEYYRNLHTHRDWMVTDVKGRACDKCDFERLGLPCRCDFKRGAFKGYYQVIHTSKQFL